MDGDKGIHYHYYFTWSAVKIYPLKTDALNLVLSMSFAHLALATAPSVVFLYLPIKIIILCYPSIDASFHICSPHY